MLLLWEQHGAGPSAGGIVDEPKTWFDENSTESL